VVKFLKHKPAWRVIPLIPALGRLRQEDGMVVQVQPGLNSETLSQKNKTTTHKNFSKTKLIVRDLKNSIQNFYQEKVIVKG
jgi:hypothetical protein